MLASITFLFLWNNPSLNETLCYGLVGIGRVDFESETTFGYYAKTYRLAQKTEGKGEEGLDVDLTMYPYEIVYLHLL